MGRQEDQLRQDRTTAAGLTGGAVVCVLLAAGSGQRWPVLLAAGMLVGAVAVYRRTVLDQAYSYWIAWAAGAVLSLLLLWAQPADMREAARLLALPWAAVSALVAVILFVRWRSHRDGHLDWVVEHPDFGLLRREHTKRAALAWAKYEYMKPCRIFRLDAAPELADQTPLYPHPDRPGQAVPRPDASPS